MARLRRTALVIVAITLSGVGLSACGTGGAVSDAKASCVYVDKALALQKLSTAPGTSKQQQSKLESQAMTELLRATPLAAQATSQDGSWNPLMTTINEAERVPLSYLATSLQRMCEVANSANPYLGA